MNLGAILRLTSDPQLEEKGRWEEAEPRWAGCSELVGRKGNPFSWKAGE